MKILDRMLFLIFIAFSQNIQADEASPIINMCPSLPKEIASLEPKYKDFVTEKSPSNKWNQQYEKYTKAKDVFEIKYRKEIDKVDEEWEKLNENYSP